MAVETSGTRVAMMPGKYPGDAATAAIVGHARS
jgi:hypothetical protein